MAHKSWAACALALIVSAIVFSWVLRPAADYKNRLRIERQERRAALDRQRIIISSGKALKATEQSPSPSGSLQQEASALLTEIDRLARQAGAHVAGMKPRQTELERNAEGRGVEVEINCSERSLVEFLYLTQKSRLLLIVSRLSISLASDETGAPLAARAWIEKAGPYRRI